MKQQTKEFYKSVGVILKESGTQLIGQCPFCSKDKFYVDEERTVYSCKVCGESGNSSTIMGALWNQVFSKKIGVLIRKNLGEYRGMPEDVFNDDNLGYNPLTKEPIVVVRNPENKVISLRRLVDHRKNGSTKRLWMNVPGGANGLIGIEHLNDEQKVYICEGEWDRFAWKWALRKCGKDDTNVLAVPGADNHNPEWKPYLDGKEVITLYDADEPGRQGCFKMTKRVLKGSARVIRHLNWDAEKRDGYDIHDLVKENRSNPINAINYVNANVKFTPQGTAKEDTSTKKSKEELHRINSEEEQAKLEPITAEELHKVFHKWLVLHNTDMIDVAMASLWATYLPGDPLWMMFVAASGGGKSETLMSLTPWSKCFDASSMTPHSIASGFPGEKDVSLLAKLEGKQAAVVIKDLTPMMKNASEFDEIIGIFRDAYDGNFVKVFGNGVTRRYENLNFGMLVGVTTIIDKFDSVALGERFVKFRPEHELNRDDDAIFEALLEKGHTDLTPMRPELRKACLSCLARKFDPEDIPTETVDFKRATWHLASICAKMRAAAPMNEWTGKQEAVPMSEPPFRLQKQLIKLAKGLALHFQCKDLMDEKIMSIVRRVAIHTPNIMAVRVARILYDRFTVSAVEVRDIVEIEHSLKPETVREILDKLVLTNCVERFQNAEMKTVYQLDLKLYNRLKDMKVFSDLPTCDPLYRRKAFTIRKKS